MELAWICRYGHQDVFRILGRSAETSPLSKLESAVFAACLLEHFVAEMKAKSGDPTPSVEDD